MMTEQVISQSKHMAQSLSLWLLIAPLEVNGLREGPLASSSHPGMLFRAHSPTAGQDCAITIYRGRQKIVYTF